RITEPAHEQTIWRKDGASGRDGYAVLVREQQPRRFCSVVSLRTQIPVDDGWVGIHIPQENGLPGCTRANREGVAGRDVEPLESDLGIGVGGTGGTTQLNDCAGLNVRNRVAGERRPSNGNRTIAITEDCPRPLSSRQRTRQYERKREQEEPGRGTARGLHRSLPKDGAHGETLVTHSASVNARFNCTLVQVAETPLILSLEGLAK